MKMLDSKAEFGNIEFSLIFWEGHFTSQMEAEISSGAVIEGKIQVVWCLEGEMEVDNKLVVGLLKNIGLDYCVLQLLLKDQVFLLEDFQSV